jgi:DHA1 family bicyclomycin/chloramphenicol resistance-like MFS transporter
MRIAPQSHFFTVFVASFPAMASLSTDMCLPALGGIGSEFAASPASVGLVVSLFLAGFGLAQLAFGPLSDRFGRRPALIGAGVLFLATGLGCMLANSITSLNIWRFLQGAGAGGGLVVATAVVRDLFEGAAARTRFAYVAAAMMVAPLIAPSLGALVFQAAGWRAIFATMMVAGILLVLVVILGFSESIRSTNPAALRPGRLAANYWRVLRHRSAFGHVLIRALSFGCMFAYISGSPFVFIVQEGFSPRAFGLIFACTAIGLMIGSVLAGRLARRHVGAQVMATGLLVSAVASAAVLTLALTGHFSLATALPLLVLNFIATGAISPNATHGAMEPLAGIAGSASAVLGCTQMAGATLSSILVGLLYRGTPLAMTEMMAAFALLALLVWAVMIRETPGRKRRAAVRPTTNAAIGAGLDTKLG